MQQRYYDPLIGRFYSNDPVDMLGHMQLGNPAMGFNRYAYVNNNPYKYIDRDGRFLFLAVVPAIEYTLGMAVFDGLVVGSLAWGIANSTSDTDDNDCDTGTSGCSGINKGKKGKEFRGGKKKDRDRWGKYSGKKFKDFRKWWEKEKQKDGSRSDLETEDDRDEAYEDYKADQQEEKQEEKQEESKSGRMK